MSKLKMTVAQAFKLRGKSRLNRTELTFALAYELKWFTPEESKEVLEAALRLGLLTEEGGKLSPAFNAKDVDVPGDFRPGPDVLSEKSLLESLVELLGTAGIGHETAREMIRTKEAEYGGLVTAEVAAIVIAKEKKLDVEPYIDEAYRQLLENTNGSSEVFG